jgi:CheY-like chemotaxis protein
VERDTWAKIRSYAHRSILSLTDRNRTGCPRNIHERHHAPHILVIDDDIGVRELMIEYLGRNDLRVTAGASGREMFEVLEREAIDLVLLDLKLPGEDGMQLARALRERGNVPIVLLTGRNEEADRVMGLELGADDYVTKPFSTRELLARVRGRPAPLPGAGNTARARQRAPRLPVLGLGVEPAHQTPDVARRHCSGAVERRVQPAKRVLPRPSARAFARAAAVDVPAARGRRFTIVRWIRRYAGFAPKSSVMPRPPR